MSNTFPTLIIAPEREKPIRNRHPWVFSGAIQRIEGTPDPGDMVEVRAPDGRFLARGYYNPKSQIQARLLTWDESERINDTWWRRTLARVVTRRAAYFDRGPQAAFRLVNAENDFVPGLIVDKYGDYLVLQALTLGIDARKHQLAEILAELVKAKGVYERSDVDVRRLEGLPETTGTLWGTEPPQLIEIVEDGGVRLLVDVRQGHKTGTYLDQAANRALAGDIAARMQARSVLNVFSYTGGFGLHTAKRGISTTNLDASNEALALSEQAYALNSLEGEHITGDAFAFLRDQAEQRVKYDLVVLDPPKFAQSKQHVERAARGYKDINLHAMRLVRSGGYLFTFSCSGAVDADLFQKIVFGALADSGRTGQIVRWLSAGEDHPVALTFPEGAYLKGLMVRVE